MPDSHAVAHHNPALQHHFENMEQQREASNLGMWIFLVTEVMFFGGMFTGYLVYRLWYFQGFAAASSSLNLWQGGINTAVLIVSSFTMAMAVHSAQLGRRKAIVFYMIATILLGSVFLGVKGFEYRDKFVHHHVPGPDFKFEEGGEHHEVLGHQQQFSSVDPRQAQIFFSFYFAMTGMHALHMIIGIAILAAMTFLAWRGRYHQDYFAPVENFGLYWHFVDIVWIFLFPLLYLISRHH